MSKLNHRFIDDLLHHCHSRIHSAEMLIRAFENDNTNEYVIESKDEIAVYKDAIKLIETLKND